VNITQRCLRWSKSLWSKSRVPKRKYLTLRGAGGGGRIVYLIMAMNVVFLESEFEVYVMCNGVSLCLDYTIHSIVERYLILQYVEKGASGHAST
jgi:hypothetical protein